jgi:hypothetical protein
MLTIPTKNIFTDTNIRVNLGEAIIKKTKENKKQESRNYHFGQGIHIRVTI